MGDYFEDEQGEHWPGMEESPVIGLRLNHAKNLCVEPCPIHAPSEHPLNQAPLLWRGDRGLMERLCPHGVGHPDPDDLAYKRTVYPHDYEQMAYDVHGCDGCCRKEK